MIVAFGIALLSPVLLALKGLYLATYVIAMFSIAHALTVKLNKIIISNFSIETMYRLSIFVHILFVLISLLYFISPLYMVIGDNILGILEIALFSTFSMALNNFITSETPDEMSKFQIVRNSIWADGFLLGLVLSTIILYFFSNSVLIIFFIIFNSFFSIWLIYNWNFYKNKQYCLSIHKSP